jgi:hypothetical protein
MSSSKVNSYEDIVALNNAVYFQTNDLRRQELTLEWNKWSQDSAISSPLPMRREPKHSSHFSCEGLSSFLLSSDLLVAWSLLFEFIRELLRPGVLTKHGNVLL